MVAITPTVVDPDIVDLIFSTTVKYDSRLTSLSSGAIAEKVIDTIQSYKTNSLLKFGSIFRYSSLSTQVDKTDTSIINNLTTLTAKKEYFLRLQLLIVIPFISIIKFIMHLQHMKVQ